MVASPPLGSSALLTDEQQTPPPPKTAVSPPPISTLDTSLSAPLLAAVQTREMGAAAEAFALLRTKLAGAPPSIAKSLVCARTAAPDCPSHIAERAFRGDTKQEANLELSWRMGEDRQEEEQTSSWPIGRRRRASRSSRCCRRTRPLSPSCALRFSFSAPHA
mmetsp:Transcript_9567/g.23759  ORF Transcript_9567/g.23759 Transcript_9567/m.23759 type:complete len:162 (-) Transcript_9567:1507-1992(-)